MEELAKLTVKEMNALEQFRNRINDVRDQLDAFQSHDINLLRWIRAREFNLDKAEDMFRKSLKWREENGMDKVLDAEIPEFLLRELPFQVFGHDRDGCVVCMIPLGRWDLKRVSELGYTRQYITYVDQILERGIAYMRKNTTRERIYTQFSLIFDFDQFSLSQVLSKQVVSMMIEILRRFEANYPETLKRGFAINAPKIFELLWALLKPVLNTHTLSKVSIYGSNTAQWRAALVELMDHKELPSPYGGSNATHPFYHPSHGMDWPARAEFFDDSEFLKVIIPPCDKLVKSYDLSIGDRLSFNFRTELYDIGFEILCNEKQLFPYAKADSHVCTQDGLIDCVATGTYSLVFDNTFSKFRSKTLFFAIRVHTPSKGA